MNTHSTESARDEFVDALTDEWPDTPTGWVTFGDKYQLADDLVAVMVENPHVRRAFDGSAGVS